MSHLILNETNALSICLIRSRTVFSVHLMRDGKRSQALIWGEAILTLVGAENGIVPEIDDVARIALQAALAFEPRNEALVIVKARLALTVVDRCDAHETGAHRHAAHDALVQVRQRKDETRELFGEIDFSLNLPDHIEISADRELLQQAVTNVISNCIEHASGLTRISISLLDRNDSVILSIADDGCGMPQAAMNALFRDVERSPELINLSHGAGLGLELVRAVAEKHNGSLHVESRENVGTTIRLSLSKGIPVSRVMRCEPEAYKLGPAALYTAFANCLPEDFFAGKYMD